MSSKLSDIINALDDHEEALREFAVLLRTKHISQITEDQRIKSHNTRITLLQHIEKALNQQ